MAAAFNVPVMKAEKTNQNPSNGSNVPTPLSGNSRPNMFASTHGDSNDNPFANRLVDTPSIKEPTPAVDKRDIEERMLTLFNCPALPADLTVANISRAFDGKISVRELIETYYNYASFAGDIDDSSSKRQPHGTYDSTDDNTILTVCNDCKVPSKTTGDITPSSIIKFFGNRLTPSDVMNAFMKMALISDVCGSTPDMIDPVLGASYIHEANAQKIFDIIFNASPYVISMREFKERLREGNIRLGTSPLIVVNEKDLFIILPVSNYTRCRLNKEHKLYCRVISPFSSSNEGTNSRQNDVMIPIRTGIDPGSPDDVRAQRSFQFAGILYNAYECKDESIVVGYPAYADKSIVLDQDDMIMIKTITLSSTRLQEKFDQLAGESTRPLSYEKLRDTKIASPTISRDDIVRLRETGNFVDHYLVVVKKAQSVIDSRANIKDCSDCVELVIPLKPANQDERIRSFDDPFTNESMYIYVSNDDLLEFNACAITSIPGASVRREQRGEYFYKRYYRETDKKVDDLAGTLLKTAINDCCEQMQEDDIVEVINQLTTKTSQMANNGALDGSAPCLAVNFLMVAPVKAVIDQDPDLVIGITTVDALDMNSYRDRIHVSRSYGDNLHEIYEDMAAAIESDSK